MPVYGYCELGTHLTSWQGSEPPTCTLQEWQDFFVWIRKLREDESYEESRQAILAYDTRAEKIKQNVKRTTDPFNMNDWGCHFCGSFADHSEGVCSHCWSRILLTKMQGR